MLWLLPGSSFFPYTTLFRSEERQVVASGAVWDGIDDEKLGRMPNLPADQEERPRRHRGGLLGWLFGDSDDDEDTPRSEEHTSELQSRFDLVCRLLLEKKNRQ